MSSPDYTLRRATVDDLIGLKQLWQRAHLQVLDLEKRLTEFQLIVTDGGDLLGAVGLQIDGKQGRVHSEAFTQLEDQDQHRQQLWERIQSIARNHALVRLWTRESAPFWTQRGFQEPTEEVLQKLPAVFGEGSKPWLSLQLREENIAVISLEKELELFQASQQASSERLLQQARVLRAVVFVILGIAVLVGLYFLVQIFLKNPSLLKGGR
jgi:N-acetylglutamate synthase-like GNAT family acetyltransferase